MKILFLSVGKENEANLKPAIDSFTRRIQHYFPVEWKFIGLSGKKTATTITNLKQKESVLVLNILKPDDQVIALDEKGTQLNSYEVASHLQKSANESAKRLVFIIGGAYGLDNTVLKKAQFIWSLSPLTFPHQLVRLILAEQVYRACTILKNEKYHHD